MKYEIGTPRISEKLHEMMISKEESPRTLYSERNDTYYMHYKDLALTRTEWNEFTSDSVVVSKENLITILEIYNYFQ